MNQDAMKRQAAEAAAATEFLERLPEGFDSFLGEKGVRLSGGQREVEAILSLLEQVSDVQYAHDSSFSMATTGISGTAL